MALVGCRIGHAGELDAFDGRLESNDTHAKTYSWGIEYRERLSDHFAAGFVWLNEGHLPNNHRDGQSVQLWWRSRADPAGWVFEAGIGPYRYYDTHYLTPDPAFHDAHGWGGLASASLDWYFANHWFTFLRANQASASDKYGSTSLGLGLGYRFTTGLETAPSPTEPLWEVDGLLGERIANTSHSEAGLAGGLGFRRTLSEHVSASATAIDAAGTRLNWRDGFAAQLWLEQRLTSSFSVGVGAGAFVVSQDDSIKDAQSPSNLAAIVSVTIAYSFTAQWLTRVVWDRIGTGDDHDCDILQFAVGYRF